jgi:uncharacterized membrane protein HdeD (DUF308 family)
MLPTARTARIVAGLAFLLGAAVLFTGLVTLGSPTTTTLVAVVDLAIGVWLLVSGARFERENHTVKSQ